MRAALTKRVLDSLEKLAKSDAEKYEQFWVEFGQVLKEGVAEDFTNKDKIAGLLRFATSTSESDAHCLLYTSPSPRDLSTSRMPSSA